MSEKKTTLSSLRSQDWRIVKYETEKLNDLLANIPANDITELNDLIYAGTKLVREKIRVSLKTTNRMSKSRWECRIESQMKRLRHQAKILRQNS